MHHGGLWRVAFVLLGLVHGVLRCGLPAEVIVRVTTGLARVAFGALRGPFVRLATDLAAALVPRLLQLGRDLSGDRRQEEGRCAEGCPGSGRPCARTPAKSSKRSAFREKRPCLSFVTTVSDSSSLSPEATAATQFDGDKITRISMRLDGMDHWSLLAALVTGFSMQLISSVTLSDFTESSLLLPQVLFVFFGMVATISAFYATMVFGLCNLYGRTALGLQKDTGYLRFITNTAVFRENAFVALLTSIASIIATISFMLFLKTPFSTALVSCLGALLACSKASLHMSSIMSSATKEIYT